MTDYAIDDFCMIRASLCVNKAGIFQGVPCMRIFCMQTMLQGLFEGNFSLAEIFPRGLYTRCGLWSGKIQYTRYTAHSSAGEGIEFGFLGSGVRG